jgi:hypothetical protein
MFVIYHEIRLDPSVTSLSIAEDEWAINPNDHVMQHGPTETAFHISVDEKENEGEPITTGDFSSRLVAIRDGRALPPPAVIETLGRESIVLYLVAMGYTPKRTQPEAAAIPPEMLQNAHAC